MKNKILILLAGLFIISSCGAPNYLPNVDHIGTNPYGAYIKVYSELEYIIVGELLAVEEAQIYVLSESWIDSIPVDKVYKYRITYAKAKNYAWSIPLLLAAAAPTGYGGWAILGSLGLLTSISATVSARRAVQYNQKQVSIDSLYMFARYPQGLPEGLDLNSLISKAPDSIH